MKAKFEGRSEPERRKLRELQRVVGERKMKRRLITMKNPTTALGVSSYPVFSEKLLLLLQEGSRRNQMCLVKAVCP